MNIAKIFAIFFIFKMHQIQFRPRLHTRPRWEAHSAPQTPSWILGRERENEEGEDGKERGEEGKGRNGRRKERDEWGGVTFWDILLTDRRTDRQTQGIIVPPQLHGRTFEPHIDIIRSTLRSRPKKRSGGTAATYEDNTFWSDIGLIQRKGDRPDTEQRHYYTQRFRKRAVIVMHKLGLLLAAIFLDPCMLPVAAVPLRVTMIVDWNWYRYTYMNFYAESTTERPKPYCPNNSRVRHTVPKTVPGSHSHSEVMGRIHTCTLKHTH